jgi:hypothetical protein
VSRLIKKEINKVKEKVVNYKLKLISLIYKDKEQQIVQQLEIVVIISKKRVVK